jgi:hypothetical protein
MMAGIETVSEARVKKRSHSWFSTSPYWGLPILADGAIIAGLGAKIINLAFITSRILDRRRRCHNYIFHI